MRSVGQGRNAFGIWNSVFGILADDIGLWYFLTVQTSGSVCVILENVCGIWVQFSTLQICDRMR